MHERDAFALDHVHTHRSGVQQDIHDVVIKQVYFVNVEQTAVGGGKHTRLEVTFPFLDGLFDIKRAYHAIFRRGDGQVHKGGCSHVSGDVLSYSEAFLAFGAPGGRSVRIAAEAAIINDFHAGKQGRQCPRCGGFCSAAFTADQDAADAGVNSVQDEGASHALLSYDCSKWKNR